MVSRRSVVASLLAAPLLMRSRFALAAVPDGLSSQWLDIKGTPIQVMFQMPTGRIDRILLVFHGVSRHPNNYRNAARPLGDAGKCLIAAPYFDEKRFPNADYQKGGVGNHAVGKRTVDLIAPLVQEIKNALGADRPYYLVGHSAGAQFLQKVASFTPGDAKAIVAANPGEHLLPTLDESYPYGLGGLKLKGGPDEGLRRYLAAPLVFYQGSADTKHDDHFPDGARAMRQGPTRYARGLKCFAMGKELAGAKEWAFGWRLVEAPGVGHSAKNMFAHRNAIDAVFGA